MSVLLDRPLGMLLDLRDVPDLRPEVEAFVVRVAELALQVAQAAPAGALATALASTSPVTLLGTAADLLIASNAVSPAAGALVRGRLLVAALLEATGGLWSAGDAQAQLDVSRATLKSWRDERKVLALPLGEQGCGYPVVQFARPATDLERPRPHRGMSDVLQAAGDALTPAELFALLATPQPALNDQTGWQALASGDPGARMRVAALVKHVATPADVGASPA
jgi:hypothetical protein